MLVIKASSGTIGAVFANAIWPFYKKNLAIVILKRKNIFCMLQVIQLQLVTVCLEVQYFSKMDLKQL